MTVAVLVLAAGGSRRLGRPKQLVRMHGRSLLALAVTRALDLGPLWIGVVVGAGASRLAAELSSSPVEIVVARNWRQGLSASLRAGLARVPRQATDLLVTTVDQWAVTSSDLRRLLRQRGRSPVAAAYDGVLGIPALFPRRAWRALGALEGDRGARALLEAPGVRAVAVEAAAVDLDTPEDLRRLRASNRRIHDLKYIL